MREEDQFDEIIRSRFSEKEFPFDEENWEKAEAMLDFSKRRKSAFKWSAVFLLGLCAGVVLMLPFVGNKNGANINPAGQVSNELQEMATRNSKSKSGNEIAERRKEEKKSRIFRTQQEIQSEEQELSNSPKNQKNIADISRPEMNPVVPISSDSNVLKTENSLKEEMLASNASGKKTDSESAIADTDPKLISNQVLLPEKQTATKELEETKTANVPSQNISTITEGSAKNMGDTISALAQKEPRGTNQSTQPEASLAQLQFTEQMPVQQTEIKKVPVLDETGSVNNMNQHVSVHTQRTDSIQPATDISAEISLSAGHADVKTDSLSAVPQSNSTELPPAAQSLTSATIFSVDAGGNYERGWSYNDTAEARGFNPVLGIGITHYFNQTWSLYSGIQYGSIAHLKASQKTFSSKTFDFGYNSVDTIVDTKLLYYAVLPIQFQYHFNSKNSIGIGGSVSYLVNTKSNITINTMAGDSIQTSGAQKTEMGYYAGAFKRWDASLSVAYRRKISEKFGISASANYGLLDIKSNSFFSREKFERNIGLKLILSYNLFDF